MGENFARGERQVDDMQNKGWRRGAPSGWFFRHEQQALAKIAKNAKGTAVSSSRLTMRVMPCSMSASPNWTS
ncbi:MAG: hypothetical protein U5S82_16125 [Gammaproteobacteria bacterium]|nr:hypothetical protein [Gammaproteobacteria bacterium]